MFDRLHGIIINHLRRIGYRNVTRTQAFKEAHVARGSYKCNTCQLDFKRSEVHGDHVDPVIDPVAGFVDWNNYITRLFYGQIQVLCKGCHKTKTKAENKVRWEEVE